MTDQVVRGHRVLRQRLDMNSRLGEPADTVHQIVLDCVAQMVRLDQGGA
jgi:hypothetical protein